MGSGVMVPSDPPLWLLEDEEEDTLDAEGLLNGMRDAMMSESPAPEARAAAAS
jgi:hypothetical protein